MALHKLPMIDASEELRFVARSEQMWPDSGILVFVYGYKVHQAAKAWPSK